MLLKVHNAKNFPLAGLENHTHLALPRIYLEYHLYLFINLSLFYYIFKTVKTLTASCTISLYKSLVFCESSSSTNNAPDLPDQK